MYEVFVSDRQGIEDKLNGVLQLGPFQNSGLAVGALTLIFTTPAVTVTFSGSAGDILTMDQIATEIQAALVGAGATAFTCVKRVLTNQGNQISQDLKGGKPDASVCLILQLDTAMAINFTGTANSLFKLSTTVATSRSGKIGATKVLGFTQGLAPAHYAMIIDLS